MAEVVPFPTGRCRRAGPEHAGARVIPLRERPLPQIEPAPSCIDCIHSLIGSVTYCTKFREEILIEELTASECEEFERG